ncbi:MAG: recombinase family protein [Hyphomicrobium sp.]|nr:recombinase family protein [Hyphomicrobium sp.]
MQRLFNDVRDGKVDCVVVYKVDRLTRSLLPTSPRSSRYSTRRLYRLSP